MEKRLVEINEAITTGYDVLSNAQAVLDNLNSAKMWGLFDMFSNRSFFTSLFKHSKLDDAQEDLENLKYSLRIFNSELNDVKVYENINNVNFDGFMKFFDIFCDNFFVDIYALSKISESKEKIESLIDEVNRIINQLENNR